METMEQVRDALLELQKEHELGCPGGGRPCYRDRASKIGYLAHCLGIRGPNMWAEVMAFTLEYDATCVNRNCLHQSN